MSRPPEILNPATLTVLGGNPTLSSLAVLPPGGISLSGFPGQLSLQIIAGNAAALLSASAIGGAVVTGNGNTLSLSGSALQVNDALASLELTEPTGAGFDVLSLSATAPGLAAQTAIAVDIIPPTGPAFVAPATLVTIAPNALDSLPYLYLSDPIASGLAQMGLGQQETLNLTLAVPSGVLFLPGYSDTSPIAATGLGTGEIILNLTADDIGALNSLLSGLEFAGPSLAGGEELSYALRNLAGVLPGALSFGNIFLNVAGPPGPGGTLAAGSQTAILGDATFSGGAPITGTTSVLGNVEAASGVALTPTGNLELPDNTLFLGGTSLDFGSLGANALGLGGALVIGDGADLSGPLSLGPASSLDFNGVLTSGGAETQNYQQAVTLAAGAILSGNGTLLAGNFSESGLISGPGTLAALGGESLFVSAGSIGGGADLAVGPGGVMVLGPVTPLFGVFDSTPLTIDSSVTLSFLSNAGATPITGGYAGTLGGAGGAFVINGPQVFSGHITGFAPGDALIFPGLANLTLLNETPGSFTVAGIDNAGSTVSYIIDASTPAGASPAVAYDAAGDAEVVLRPAVTVLTQAVGFVETSGVAQPLPGLSLELAYATTQSLACTLSTAHGLLSASGVAPAGSITLSAGGIAALNAQLGSLTYTGTGVADVLTLTSASGALMGLSAAVGIGVVVPGIVDGNTATEFSAAQSVTFGNTGSLALFSTPAALGELLIGGATEFAAPIQASGVAGTALVVDGGATAIFNAAATARLGGNIIIGDSAGAGTLAILTTGFSASGDLTLAVGSAADVLGSLGLGGTLDIGTGQMDLTGEFSASGLSLGSAGGFFAGGNASAQLGNTADSGTLVLAGAAQAQGGNFLLVGGGMLDLGGTSSLGLGGALQAQAGGQAQIGADATLQTSLAVLGGAMTDSGLISAENSTITGQFSLAGGTFVSQSLNLAGTLAGFGVLDAASLSGGGVLRAQDGALRVGGSVSGSIGIELAGGSALELTQGFAPGTISFQGPDALLTLDTLPQGSSGIANFSATDAVDLVGIAPSLVSYSSATGLVDIFNSQGSLAASLAMQVAQGQPTLSIGSDPAGGTLLTLGNELPCFARGTGLLTPHGYRPVESLKPGDPLITASGVSRAVRWIGRRTLDLAPRAARAALPVRILPGAFGPGLPARTLRLSPLHCVYVDGVLVPVTHLVNGATVLRESAVAMTYYHVELDRHDILLAEGLACESYLDSGNRGGLYQEVGRRSPARRAYAPTITRGARLTRLRQRLHAIALAAGFAPAYWPVLRAMAPVGEVVARISRVGHWRVARFNFAAPVRGITLLSSTACPADTDPASEDRRELGVCLECPGGVRLGQGFFPRAAADAGHWMGAVATLALDLPADELVLPLAAVVQSWVRPVDGLAPGR